MTDHTFRTNSDAVDGDLTIRIDDQRQTVVLEHRHEHGVAIIDLDGDVAIAVADALRAAGEQADAAVDAYFANA
ncbi:hypothetical protein [Smaragdicoccus niigatensis]|uniref:hypothetical protein n=1 Tax=Smaragdicoccus niigatensis TaxID=359359 RepID=UPI000361B3F1|nr:hypothetical protein [Smaragdicoccus niigatensis]